MKKFEKENVVELEEIYDDEEVTEEEDEEAVEIKSKWSLKKKLAIGGSVLIGLVLGAVALGSKKKSDDNVVEVNFDEDTDDEDGTANFETTEEGPVDE